MSIVRCPYCVTYDEFRPMNQHLESDNLVRFVCGKCGHVDKPGDNDFRCYCNRCREIRLPAGLGFSRAS
jgi:NADH pyrophosphatase NudC (nudix superfamily)